MGRFLNQGNRKFAEFSQSKYFVDKTALINKLIQKDADEKFVCSSRPRRFGKSVTADMLVAFFSRGTDSGSLFEPLKCVKDTLFRENINHYDTIFVDIQAQFGAARFEHEPPVQYINRNIVRELREAYKEIENPAFSGSALATVLTEIYYRTGRQFVIIFDEWDYPIREYGEDSPDRKDYIEWLRSLFKNSDAKEYVRLAYLTGIMPIVRTKGQSAVNNFMEYTMTNPMDLAQDIGFTEEEVQALCERFDVSFEQIKEWYNGYYLNGIAMYNPLSVVRALSCRQFQQYWTTTGTYGDIEDLISRNFDGLREDVLRMLSGNRVPVTVANGKNDLQSFKNKSEVLTALIHLGYFAYDPDKREAYVPNKEIQEVFYQYMEDNGQEPLSRFMKCSEQILSAVMEGDAAMTAQQIQSVHNDFISSIEYNDENSLSCTIMIALISAFRYYHRPIREFPCGKGFADLVYQPLASQPNRPVMVVELKWDKSAAAAIAQIKDRQYPASLRGYAGEILLVGIDYDKKNKEHACRIERLTNFACQ
ncbi:MAG: AAA family ATPase [Lachnospiraceae bacterium]|nr:AAA family ATPase [Lachnospiraceae bacterium]